MFGLKKKPVAQTDKLDVQVHVVGNAQIFALTQKIWGENQRTLRIDPGTGKEFLHFTYANPKCVIWVERDPKRHQLFEMVVRWELDHTHEVFVILNTSQPDGDPRRVEQLLKSILSTPSIVLSNGS